VTNVIGLAVGNNISINAGIYRISAIKSATLITICNDGQGLTPGTVVQYQDSSGNLIVPLITINVNPCTNTTIIEGTILACNGGVMSPLTGLMANQVPVLINPTTGQVAFQTLGIPLLDCTALTAELTLDPALPSGPYLIQVTSTAAYTVGEIVTIGVLNFTISNIYSSLVMYLVPVVAVSAIETFPVGATVCSASCCARLTVLEDYVYSNTDAAGHKWLESQVASSTAADTTSGTLTSGQSQNSTIGTLTFVNNSDRPINLVVDYFAQCEYIVNGTAGQYAQVDFEVLGSASLTPGVAPVGLQGIATTSIIPTGATTALYQVNGHFKEVYVVPAGLTWVVEFEGSVQFAAGNAASITIAHNFARAVIQGVTQL
jgi:hypothetical protein